MSVKEKVEKEAMLVKAGERLKELRSKTGLSVHKVGRATHISGTYLSAIERGVKEPSDTVLEALSEYYKVGKSELFSLYEKLAPAETTLLLDTVFRRTIIQMSTDDRLTEEEKADIAKALAELYQSKVKERNV